MNINESRKSFENKIVWAAQELEDKNHREKKYVYNGIEIRPLFIIEDLGETLLGLTVTRQDYSKNKYATKISSGYVLGDKPYIVNTKYKFPKIDKETKEFKVDSDGNLIIHDNIAYVCNFQPTQEQIEEILSKYNDYISKNESIKEDLELTSTGEEVSKEEEIQINNDYRNQLIEMINGEWETIQDYNDLVNMLASIEEYKEYIPVIEGIIEDEHHHIGNLQNVLDKLNPDSNKDIEHGEQEAQEILDDEVKE